MTPSRRMRVAMAGAFDVANFGDLLFPLVAERELALAAPGLEIDLVPYGLNGVHRLHDEMEGFDLLLVGGGDLIRFDSHRLLRHRRSTIDFSSLWLAPTLRAAELGVPVAWNAVGLPRRIQGRHRSALAAAAGAVGHLAVRDARSARLLTEAHPSARPVLVPDTAFGTGSVIPRLGPPVEGCPGRYVLVQADPRLAPWQRQLDEVVSDAREQGFGVVEVEISPAIRDRLGALHLPRDTVRLPDWPSPLELTRMISGAGAVIGTSLHLSIVAASYGVPVHRPPRSLLRHPTPRVRKYALVEKIDGVTVWKRRSAAPVSLREPGRPAPAPFAAELREHWKAVAGLVPASAYSAPPAAAISR